MFRKETCSIHGFFPNKNCFYCQIRVDMENGEQQQNGELFCNEIMPDSSVLSGRERNGSDRLECNKRPHLFTESDITAGLSGFDSGSIDETITVLSPTGTNIKRVRTIDSGETRPIDAEAISGFGSIDLPILSRKRCGRCELIDSFKGYFEGLYQILIDKLFIYNNLIQIGATICHAIAHTGTNERYPDGLNKLLEYVDKNGPSKRQKCQDWLVGIHKWESPRCDRSHVHIVHRCPTFTRTHSLCRCAYLDGFESAGFILQREYIRKPGPRYFEKVLLYLSQNGHWLKKVYIAGKNIESEYNFTGESLRTCKCGDEPIDKSGLIDSDHEDFCGVRLGKLTSKEDDVIYGEESESSDNGKPGKYQWRQLLGEKASEKILEWAVCSENDFKNHPQFKIEFPMLYWNKQLFTKIVSDVAWDDAVSKINRMSFREIVENRYNNLKSFLNYEKSYYAPEYSAKLIGRLILEQCNNLIPEAQQFVDELWGVLDRCYPKLNTFCLVSPPSSGKTFLYNTIEDICNPSVGHIRNVTKNSDPFTYMDAVNKRVNFWNECIITGKEPIETAKEV